MNKRITNKITEQDSKCTQPVDFKLATAKKGNMFSVNYPLLLCLTTLRAEAIVSTEIIKAIQNWVWAQGEDKSCFGLILESEALQPGGFQIGSMLNRGD